MVPDALRVYEIVLCLDAHVHIHLGALEITLFRFREPLINSALSG